MHKLTDLKLQKSQIQAYYLPIWYCIHSTDYNLIQTIQTSSLYLNAQLNNILKTYVKTVTINII